jgi:DNA repair protein RecN (Recombination protein N)
MLQSLHIRDYALADDLAVTLGPGLNVITGETGAGKSILVGALGLALGDRADRGQIRSGAESCSVTAVFDLAEPELIAPLLTEAGVPASGDGSLVLRRVVAAAGSGKALVNDTPVTLRLLQRLGDALVDLHGPHEHQSLFQPSFQLALLDAYGRLDAARAAYGAAYEAWQELERRRVDLAAGDPAAFAREAEMLRFQVREIEEARVSAEEESAVRAEHALLGHAQRIAELGQAAQAALAEGEGSAFSALAAAQQSLADLAGLAPEAAAWRQEARDLAVRVQELSDTLGRLLQRLEADPGRLQWLDERLALYRRLCRKYGPDVPALLAFLDRARTRLRDLESREERLAALEVEAAAARTAALAAGAPLARGRRTAAGRLGRAVAKELRALGFNQAALEVEVRSADPSPSGLDTVEFQFAPNPGEPAHPLRDTASSGEISRVMLALKSVLAEQDRVPVLIFDEIDVNLGGKTAHAVGRKLAALARRRQVLVITHLPQVAVHGSRHLSVAKTATGGRTVTRVALLEGEARVEEIARMLGGRDLTTVALRHAREMLDAPGGDSA